MLQLTAMDYNRLEQTNRLDVCVAGSEMNTAVAAERLGLNTAFVTRLTNNGLGRMIANKAREHGVDTSNIIWTEDDRVGLFFLEEGANPRPRSVIYDRGNAAITKFAPESLSWGPLLEDCTLFHTSGITPALSNSVRETVKHVMKKAKDTDTKVSIDLNYRAKLWSEQEAQACMEELMEYTDLLVTSEEDTERVFNITGEDYSEVAQKLEAEFDLEAVAITIRDNISMWRNNWTAIAYKDGKTYSDTNYELELVGRVGGGDSFTGGFLYGYLTGDIKKALEYGNASSALKQTNPGDFNWATKEEVQTLAEGGQRVRVDR